jgi:pimeloyl-ACP methyl ester carboxylesterase
MACTSSAPRSQDASDGSSAEPDAADASAPADQGPAQDAPAGLDAPGADLGVDLGVDASDVGLDGGSTVAVALPCTDAIQDVYVTPSGLPGLTAASHGDIVRCARDLTYDRAGVDALLAAHGAVGVRALNGVRFYRVMYRAQRGNGGSGTSSARIYVPSTSVTSTHALVVIGHPSVGLAALCAPSKDASSLSNLALPFAARGYYVIAPDYPGLGDEGTQSYLDNHDQAYAMLDAARALRKFLTDQGGTSHVALVGHSQGGGAALSAQALARVYAPELSVDAVVGLAPQWPTRLNSFKFIDALSQPLALTISFGITTSAVVALETYAWWENEVGAGMGTSVFQSQFASGVVAAIRSLCLVEIGGYIQGTELHVQDWLESSLREGLLACAQSATSTSCAGSGRTLYQLMSSNLVTGDPGGAPVLYIQGDADIVMPPKEEASCNVVKLEQDGVPLQICVEPGASHNGVVGAAIGFAIDWVEAVVAGSARPACTDVALPACTP